MTSPSSLAVLLASLRAALATIQAPWNPVTVHSARADVMGVADEKFGLLASVTSPTVALAMVAAVNALVPEDRGGSGLLEQVERLLGIIDERRAAIVGYQRSLEEMHAAIEQERVRLAGCGVAARGGVSPEHVVGRDSYGWSDSYQATLDLRRAYDAEHAELAALKPRTNLEMMSHVFEDADPAAAKEPSSLLAALQWFHDEVSAILSEMVARVGMANLRPILELRTDPRYEPIRSARKEGA